MRSGLTPGQQAQATNTAPADAGREPAWHRRERRERQSARGLIAVDRARALLAQHHGGGGMRGATRWCVRHADCAHTAVGTYGLSLTEITGSGHLGSQQKLDEGSVLDLNRSF